MKSVGNKIIILLIVVFTISQFHPSRIITILYTIITAVIMIFSLIYSKKLSRYFGAIMVGIGVIILIYDRQSADMWIEGITKNLPLVCLIVIAPLLGVPITLGKYHENLAEFTTRFKEKSQYLYLIISGLFTLIAPITNMGSIYIIHSMLEKLRLPNEFLGRVYVRGITSVHTWSPYFASVFLVVFSLNIPIYKYLPFGFILSLVQILVAYILFIFVEMKKIEFDLNVRTTNKGNQKLLELLMVIILLTGFIFIFEPYILINISILISLIVLIFAIVWSSYLNELKQFIGSVFQYISSIFPNKADEINLLLTAGFFGVVLSETPVSIVINKLWKELANISIFALILGTILIVAFLSFIGVHQIVTISTIIATVSYEDLGINVIIMAMMLLSAWSVSVTISPITPVNIIVSSVIKENVFKLILKWNLIYALTLILVQSLLIYLIHIFMFC